MTSYPQELTLRQMLPSPDSFRAGEQAAMEQGVELRAITELARRTHQMGGQFAGWPKFEFTDGLDFLDTRTMDASVWVIPR